MKRIFNIHYLPIFIVVLLITIFVFNKSSKHEDNSSMQIEQQFQELESRDDLAQATLSGGCFWCMEGPFETMEGVAEVISGYSGGTLENPTYEQVISGSTGHRESVRIYFDSGVVSFSEILETYWHQVDPTDEGGQFADRGEQYTTAIYYHDQAQKEVAEKAIATLDESGEYDKEIVTKVLPIKNFFPAEDYHQDFYKHSAERYNNYAKGSGRKDYIESVKESLNTLFSN